MIPVRTIASRTLLLTRSPPAQASSILPRKPFSSSSNSSSNGQQPVNPKERAQQLHNEIESIVKKHDQKHTEEINRAKTFSGFLDFLGKHKTNISVIVVSFLTVILSVKMVQIKQQYKELEKKLINTQGQVDQKRNLLKAVTDQSFVAQVASHCAKESEQNQSKSWFRTSSNKENIQTIVSSVLQQELDHLIGDEALTEEEKNAKRFKELQASSSNKSSSVEQQDVKLSGLLAEQSKVNEGEEVELVTDANGKVIKKSVFRI